MFPRRSLRRPSRGVGSGSARGVVVARAGIDRLDVEQRVVGEHGPNAPVPGLGAGRALLLVRRSVGELLEVADRRPAVRHLADPIGDLHGVVGVGPAEPEIVDRIEGVG